MYVECSSLFYDFSVFCCNLVYGQEKELIERHNVWLNDELTAKVNNLIELRRKHTEFEADMSAKLADVSVFILWLWTTNVSDSPINFFFIFQVEREFSECSKSLKWNKDRVKELELKLTSAQVVWYCFLWLCHVIPDTSHSFCFYVVLIKELCSSKDADAACEERFSAELSTVSFSKNI